MCDAVRDEPPAKQAKLDDSADLSGGLPSMLKTKITEVHVIICLQCVAENEYPIWRQLTKLTAEVHNKKHTFLHKIELILPLIFSTLYKNIFQLLLNVIYVEWMWYRF